MDNQRRRSLETMSSISTMTTKTTREATARAATLKLGVPPPTMTTTTMMMVVAPRSMKQAEAAIVGLHCQRAHPQVTCQDLLQPIACNTLNTRLCHHRLAVH
jgi:hypothetical protein